MTTFTELGLDAELLKALDGEGYTAPTPIQAQAIPGVMAGRDLLGIAQTGTGKTAAFALPILHRLNADRKPAPRRGARVLVLSPTRELATQIADSFRTYGKHLGFSVAVVFGGVAHRPQRDALSRGVDVLVATPGRLIDHIQERNAALETTEILVLDEADQMLDMGFIRPIRQILAKMPSRRQSLFFSATMPQEIGTLAGEMLRDPLHVAVTPVAKTADRVAQKVIHVESPKKKALLAELFADPSMTRTLVFTRTKRGADRVSKYLEGAGIGVSAIHGNKSQAQRERAMSDFKAGKIRGLIATDIAARGIDIDLVTHVVNYELPNIPESYVHRIGRTARAGAEGIAISFCDGEERAYLRDIERLTRQTIPSEDRRGDATLSAEQRSAAVAAEDAADEARGLRRGGGRGERQDRGGRSGHGRPAREGGDRQARGDRGDRGTRFGGDRNKDRGERRDRPQQAGERPAWTPEGADRGPERTERPERRERFEARGERPDRGPRPEFRRDREAPRGERSDARGERGGRSEFRGPRTDRPAGERPRFNAERGPRAEGSRDGGKRFEGKPRFNDGGARDGARRDGARPERSERSEGSIGSVKFLAGSRGPRRPEGDAGRPEGRRFEGRPNEHRSHEGRPPREGRSFEGRPAREGHATDGRRPEGQRSGGGFNASRPHGRPGDRDGRREGGPRREGGNAPRPGFRRDNGPRRDSQG